MNGPMNCARWQAFEFGFKQDRWLMRLYKLLSIVILIVLIAGLGFVYSGIYDVGADRPHTALTHWMIGQTRARSVASHSSGVVVPKLDDDELVAMGADHYAEMCAVCHLAPGAEESELRRGLYPKPPNLVERGGDLSPQEAFWSHQAWFQDDRHAGLGHYA